MNNVIQIRPCANASIALRNIADAMDRGEFASDEVTIIAGADIFHCGQVSDERAAEQAIFNMTMGIHKLMRPVIMCHDSDIK